jgi:hypothetical protein
VGLSLAPSAARPVVGEVQRVQTAQVVGQRELDRPLDQVLVDLNHTERRPFRPRGTNR